MSNQFIHSHSTLDAFETCPRRFYLTRLTRQVKEPPTEENLWGLRVHKAFENLVLNNTPLPEGMEQFGWAASVVRQAVDKAIQDGARYAAEGQLAVDRQMNPAEWREQRTWFRGVLDFYVVRPAGAILIDYKTGKFRPGSPQLARATTMIFAHNPQVNEATVAYIFLKDKKIDTHTVTRADSGEVWAKIQMAAWRVEEAIEANKFPPKPSGLCNGWCPCTGCEYNSKFTGRK